MPGAFALECWASWLATSPCPRPASTTRVNRPPPLKCSSRKFFYQACNAGVYTVFLLWNHFHVKLLNYLIITTTKDYSNDSLHTDILIYNQISLFQICFQTYSAWTRGGLLERFQPQADRRYSKRPERKIDGASHYRRTLRRNWVTMFYSFIWLSRLVATCHITMHCVSFSK